MLFYQGIQSKMKVVILCSKITKTNKKSDDDVLTTR